MKKVLEFHHVDGSIRYVKERSLKQIYGVLSKYVSSNRIGDFEYIGNQFISENNGNIYAEFFDKRYNQKTTMYIADYYDYIDEVE